MKQREPSAYEKKQIEIAMAKHRAEQQVLHKLQLKWETNAISIIKEKLEQRKAKNLYKGNDWKVRFYEEKLAIKPRLLTKLKSLIK